MEYDKEYIEGLWEGFFDDLKKYKENFDIEERIDLVKNDFTDLVNEVKKYIKSCDCDDKGN